MSPSMFEPQYEQSTLTYFGFISFFFGNLNLSQIASECVVYDLVHVAESA